MHMSFCVMLCIYTYEGILFCYIISLKTYYIDLSVVIREYVRADSRFAPTASLTGSGMSPLCMPDLVITVVAYGLAPDGTGPSGDTVMTTEKTDIIYKDFFSRNDFK